MMVAGLFLIIFGLAFLLGLAVLAPRRVTRSWDDPLGWDLDQHSCSQRDLEHRIRRGGLLMLVVWAGVGTLVFLAFRWPAHGPVLLGLVIAAELISVVILFRRGFQFPIALSRRSRT